MKSISWTKNSFNDHFLKLVKQPKTRLKNRKNIKLILFSDDLKGNSVQSLQSRTIINNLTALTGAFPTIAKLSNTELNGTIENLIAEGFECVEIVFSLNTFSHGRTSLPKLYFFSWPYPNLDGLANGQKDTKTFQLESNDFGIITLSENATKLIQEFAPANLEIISAPTLATKKQLNEETISAIKPKLLQNKPLDIEGLTIDSADFNITHGTQNLGKYGQLHPDHGIIKTTWNRQEFEIPCNTNCYGTQYMSGFYEPEPWGIWSKSNSPRINLPYVIAGNIQIKIRAVGYGNNVNRKIDLSLGSKTTNIVLNKEITTYVLNFELNHPQDKIVFGNLDLSPPESLDTRTMGIGLISLDVAPLPEENNKPAHTVKRKGLQGLVFTSYVDPEDKKYGYRDLITAFCIAMKHYDDANLIIFIPASSSLKSIKTFCKLINANKPFCCRILIIKGNLNDNNLELLKSITSYFVDFSHFESSCEHLLNFGYSGIPIVAPRHTAIDDCIDKKSKLVIDCSREPFNTTTIDGRKFIGFQYRINWESAYQTLSKAYQMAKNSTSEYLDESNRSLNTIKRLSSRKKIMDLLNISNQNISTIIMPVSLK